MPGSPGRGLGELALAGLEDDYGYQPDRMNGDNMVEALGSSG